MLKRINTWIESVHYVNGDVKVIVNFRDLAPSAGSNNIWYDIILMDQDREIKRIGGLAPITAKEATILESTLELLEKEVDIISYLNKFEDFDFSDLAGLILGYVLYSLNDGFSKGNLIFPEEISGFTREFFFNYNYDFNSRWGEEESEDVIEEEIVEEIIEEVDDDYDCDEDDEIEEEIVEEDEE